jgi:eukaryotic-like serine/threonine-protein kinase
VRTAEELARLDALLPILLKKEAEPSSPAVGVQFARVCSYKGRYEDAVRFFAQSFQAAPGLAEDLNSANRYEAACAAALGGCGMGMDAKGPDNKERAALRGQALDWLRADLSLWTKKIADGPKDRAGAHQMLQHWLIDPALTGVRDKGGLSKLPPDEQAAWPKLWSDVEVLLKKTEN